MNRTVTILFFILIIHCVSINKSLVYAQTQSTLKIDYDYLKFKKEFEKEFDLKNISTLEDKPTNIKQVFSKTKLPEWLFTLPQSNNSIIYGIGISEPGMQKDSAFQLACLRAKAICVLMAESSLKGISDYYVSEKDLSNGDILSSVYKDFSQIKSLSKISNDAFTIIKDTITVNNEAIVIGALQLNKITSAEESNSFQCFAEVMTSQVQKNNKFSSTSRLELMAGERGRNSDDNAYFQYVIKKSNDHIRCLSTFSGNTVISNTGQLSYQSDNKTQQKEDIADLSYSLQYGLWHAFSSLFLQSLVLEFQEANTQQSSLADYNSNLSQDINRLFSEIKISTHLKEVAIDNNMLRLDMEFVTKN